MPLHSIIQPDIYTKIIIWDVQESNDELLATLSLPPYRVEKYNQLSPKRQREYLGIRTCLKNLGSDLDVLYDEKGRPYLDSDHHISITHSHGKVAVGLSSYKIGIDIELKRDEKIQVIKHKYIRPDEEFVYHTSDENDYLHIIWGIKESLYKLDGGEWWSFLKNYKVSHFQLKDNHINCWISKDGHSENYHAYWQMIDNYYLVYVLDYD